MNCHNHLLLKEVDKCSPQFNGPSSTKVFSLEVFMHVHNVWIPYAISFLVQIFIVQRMQCNTCKMLYRIADYFHGQNLLLINISSVFIFLVELLLDFN